MTTNAQCARHMKSVLNTFTVAPQVVIPGGVINFNENKPYTGCSIEHDSGSSAISLVKPGMYLILANITVTTTEAGTITFNIARDGVVIPSAISSSSVGGGATTSVTIPAVVNVTRASIAYDQDGADLTVNYVGLTPADAPASAAANDDTVTATTSATNVTTIKTGNLIAIKLA